MVLSIPICHSPFRNETLLSLEVVVILGNEALYNQTDLRILNRKPLSLARLPQFKKRKKKNLHKWTIFQYRTRDLEGFTNISIILIHKDCLLFRLCKDTKRLTLIMEDQINFRGRQVAHLYPYSCGSKQQSFFKM